MTIANNFEVRPNLIQNLKTISLTLVTCLVIPIVGFFLLQSGSTLIGSLLIIAGIASVLAVIYQIFVKYKSATMILTHQGIQHLKENYLITWADIETIGTSRVETQKFVGLILISEAINSLPPHIQPSVSTNKNMFGYDLLFSELELDRPISEFIQLLEQYHNAFRR